MRRLVALAAAVAGLLTLAPALTAQGPMGGPGGGRMGGMSASLERPLVGVEGLTSQQRDSLTKLEAAYKPRFDEGMEAVRDMMMAARQARTMPDMAEIAKSRDAMRELKTQQLAAARAVLTSAQHPKFDDNVKAMDEEQAQREAQMRERMGGRPPV
jgi:hypothetical protein